MSMAGQRYLDGTPVRIGDVVEIEDDTRGLIKRVQGRGVAKIKLEGTDREVWKDLKVLTPVPSPNPSEEEESENQPKQQQQRQRQQAVGRASSPKHQLAVSPRPRKANKPGTGSGAQVSDIPGQANSKFGTKMKAVGLRSKCGPASLLEELEVRVPEPKGRQVLIKVSASALNPVDTKFRSGSVNTKPGTFPTKTLEGYTAIDGVQWNPMILGCDAAGVIEAVGGDVSTLSVGDKVYTAGAISGGANAEFVAVDERVVAKAPSTLTATQAAAMPLCILAAWEGLEALGIDLASGGSSQKGKTLLMLPGAGGVGSMVTQLATQLAGLTVIATASRPESKAAALELGASVVINHREPLKPQLEAASVPTVDYIYDGFDFTTYADQYAQVIKPFGKIVSVRGVDDANMDQSQKRKLTVAWQLMFSKCVTVAWELMFTRLLHNFEVEHQSFILNSAAKLLDDGTLKPPSITEFPWSLESFQKAHELQECGKTIGKLVISREVSEFDAIGKMVIGS